jgi:predicted RNase H-like nuclease
MPNTSTVIGVGLAWSPKNQTGLAVATVHESCVQVEVTALARSLDDIVAFIANHVSTAVTIAIDAPTVVPYQNRMRDCERHLHLDAATRHAQAAPYPGTRNLLGKCNGGRPRGEELVARLKADLHVNEVGCPPPLHFGRYAMEVFPAAAMVSLFSLTAPLHYKKKRNRTWAQCRQGLENYLERLRALDKPCLECPPELRVGLEAGKAFKEIEDRVDAVLCAYVAALAWLGQAQEIGCLESGYIVLPAAARTSSSSASEVRCAVERILPTGR